MSNYTNLTDQEKKQIIAELSHLMTVSDEYFERLCKMLNTAKKKKLFEGVIIGHQLPEGTTN